ncbi:5'/3'-nucleotidase SurE [bacterium]|nr:5'/3'-nucleotidase SurE [bacterium]MCB2179185.1 5'/3'-nucleotidase SurE [bacterium]
MTNDDGIESPGLWAAAEALSEIGFVWVVAPREQASSTGRSLPVTSDGLITIRKMNVHGQEWTVHAVGGTPAQTIQHGIMEVIGENPDLVVSGINYGLNLGNAITISGTVGAAMEANSFGVPSIAISLETDVENIYRHADDVHFNNAAYFAAYFGRRLLDRSRPLASRFLKVEVPKDATPETPWKLARLDPENYFIPYLDRERSWDEPYTLPVAFRTDIENLIPGTDSYVALIERKVAVTPLTLDMTAPVNFDTLREELG